MTGNSVALDTSAAVALVNNAELARRFLHQFQTVFLPAPALGEFLFGAANSQRRDTNEAIFEAFVTGCTVLPITAATARVYVRIRLDLKRRGLPIPVNDLWIASVCLEHQLPLATSDAHSGHIAELRTLNPYA